MSYFDIDAVSQSLLKAISSGIAGYKAYLNKSKESQAMQLGSLIDIMITQPELLDQYKPLTVSEKPQKKCVIDYIINTGLPAQIVIDEACEACNVKGSTSDSMLESILESEYYIQRLQGHNIEKELYDTAKAVADSIKTHPHTSWYLKYDCMYQVPIYWEEQGQLCKALLDIIAFDHEDKIIYPIDIKSTQYSTENFITVFERMQYDFQAEWYNRAILNWKDNPHPEYKLHNFRFIVESTKWQGCPLTYEWYPKQETFDKVFQAFNDYLWHKRNNLWQYSRYIYESEGLLHI